MRERVRCAASTTELGAVRDVLCSTRRGNGKTWLCPLALAPTLAASDPQATMTMRNPIPSSPAEVARRRLRLGVPPPRSRPDPLDADAAARFLAIAGYLAEAVDGLVEANRLLLVRLERLEEEGRRWR